ncbi:hypothetical protein PVAP13_8NG204201 [Panicum virgatum]|uniref:Uncharacterized protein n=1 Tax=Panicum virgatum TaxID=38727 RepID=A0A8T0P696_PANVG|nr:hypothetical protein PVAP13_8NG204201 [Panicum virgatum]
MPPGSQEDGAASMEAADCEDRISALPDEVIHHLLGLLPAPEAVRTCLLALVPPLEVHAQPPPRRDRRPGADRRVAEPVHVPPPARPPRPSRLLRHLRRSRAVRRRHCAGILPLGSAGCGPAPCAGANGRPGAHVQHVLLRAGREASRVQVPHEVGTLLRAVDGHDS